LTMLYHYPGMYILVAQENHLSPVQLALWDISMGTKFLDEHAFVVRWGEFVVDFSACVGGLSSAGQGWTDVFFLRYTRQTYIS
jgi:hypothetical protein